MLLHRERANDVMEKHGLDALVATLPENVYYLSDFGFSHLFVFRQYGVGAAILPRDASIPPTLLIGEVDVPYLEVNPTWMPEVRVIGSFGSHVPAETALTETETRVQRLWEEAAAKSPHSVNRQVVVGEVLRSLGLEGSRLGFDDLRVMEEVREAGVAPDTSSEAINVFREIRIVKTPAEVELMRRAAAVNEASLMAATNLLTPGRTMREVRNFWRSSMALQGAVGVEFYAGGFDRPWPMGDERYQLEEGDHLLLDCAGMYQYYWADVGRTGCVGRPSERVEEIHAGLLEVYERCVPMLQAGVSTTDIKKTAKESIRPEFAGGLVPLMHTLGVEIYDMPQPLGEIEREDFVLETDMVVNFECCLYMEFPWGVVQLEDTFLVKNGSAEKIGSLPTDLIVRPA